MRIEGYDYATGGAYFVTVCASCRGPVFGDVRDGTMCLNSVGVEVARVVDSIADHHDVTVDSSIVMPDHVHLVLVLRGDDGRSLSTVVGLFKAAASRDVGRRGMWQRGFHDHVVRDERDLDRVREYIATNPVRWALRHGWSGPDTSGSYG